MEKDLKAEEKELTDDIKNLEKKVRMIHISHLSVRRPSLPQSKYLEKQFNDAQAQLRDIVCIPDRLYKSTVSDRPTVPQRTRTVVRTN